MVAVGLFSGKKVKNAGDFLSGGGKAGAWLVCGGIMGALVSSQATIGTAQLAFHYGLSAWWFTLGSGIGCLILGLVYAKPLRKSGCITEMQIITGEYGTRIGSAGAILSAIGIFISVLSNVIACTGLVSTMFPVWPMAIAALAAILLMAVYVIFGGAWGAGLGGILKMILLYGACVVGMVCALSMTGGPSGLMDSIRQLLCGTPLGAMQQEVNGASTLASEGDLTARFLNLTARGASKDIGSGISLLLGVLSTQTYAQAIWSGKSHRSARRGAMLGTILIPPLGIAGICIGLYMRGHYLLQAEVDALTAAGQAVPDLPVLNGTIQVFPTFIMDHLPPLLAGIVLGTLLVTAVAGGAGLAFGVSTILVKDIFSRFTKGDRELLQTRLTIGGVLLAAGVLTVLVPGSAINDFGFLSMGLRGSVVLVPLSCALWCKGRIDARYVLLSVILAPLSILIGNFLPLPFDALFLGVGISILCCAFGFVSHRIRKTAGLSGMP